MQETTMSKFLVNADMVMDYIPVLSATGHKVEVGKEKRGASLTIHALIR